ncbi:SpoIIE family protein phosphatase [Mycobacterium deserti]|uniref:histidine kinase n=1 Tax=Mycobacterium deserti TaxID=2978347 RepID=A0ABT2MFS2_9MYCO|nr:SpoIIE family protein phosphatase [Mycobacterium deserti]MCT7661139.1 SpoIIE family protein phosphatase [Mycobacterium deserti]
MSAGDVDSGSVPAVFGADIEVGRDLTRVDWQATPLGSPEGWPQSLQTAINILLSSRFPMWMAWGPELTFFCNAAYRRDTLGRKYPWALGRPAREVWAEIWNDIGPRIERVLATDNATWDVALLLFVERSGYVEESYHTFSYSPLHDDEGDVAGMLCVVSEDTQRVISERRMATLRDLGSDPSVVRTEQQILAFVDRQLGHNKRDLPFTLTYLFDEQGDARLAGTSGIDVTHPAAPEELTPGAAMWPVERAAHGDSELVDLSDFPRLPTGDWPDPPVQALIVPLVQQGGSPSGFLVAALNRYRALDDDYRAFVQLVATHIAAGIGSARSYRDQQQRAEELAELDRAKTTFFSNISHEFRTPLTLILDPVAELRGRTTGVDEATRAELDVVWRNGLRLNKLVNTLLDFSRIEANRTRARYEPVDLAAVTAELASVFRSAIDRAGLEFLVDCPTIDEPVYVDPDMWEKVILNLLSNALKFTFDGTISVAVRRVDDGAVVEVADTGIGVPAHEMPRLFERFHRIENSRARSNEGSGIGLALVKELVALHGGDITAESTEGAGTTFTIRLPLGAAHLPADSVAAAGRDRVGSGAAEPFVQEALRWMPEEVSPVEVSDADFTSSSVRSASGASAPTRVLIADDNADMREYLARLLETAGYLVQTVHDGQQALNAIRADVPDLVVSDVMMPRLDGLALVAALRTDPRTAAVPVLLLSARAGQEASIEGLQSGADDYLVKPFAAAELLARVRANVELARLRVHHARWRTALVESLQEAFFVTDERGAVIEVNDAFVDILGYGPEGLPYEAVQPWWPSADTEPEAYREVAESFESMLREGHGSFTAPVRHRDGHRLWVAVTFNHAEDPETGRRVMVGTFRDVTAEHYTVQREAALAALNQQLAQADTLDEALRAAAGELRTLWRARRVLAATFTGDAADMPDVEPRLLCVGDPVRWAELPMRTRRLVDRLRHGNVLTTHAAEPAIAGIALQHPLGVLVVCVELAEQRHFSPEELTLFTVLAGRLGQGLQRVHQIDQQRETALALQEAILGPAYLPSGFVARYQPAALPLQVGGDWYDLVNLDDGRIALVVGDCVGHGLNAAAIMGQLRSACRALLLENPSPSAVFAGMDSFAVRLPGARGATAFCAVLSPETGELVYSSAGHPPPVVVTADGAVELLDSASGTPLGLPFQQVRPETRFVLPSRATLLLYTDGLVERRREPLDKGIDRAADLITDSGAVTLDDLADRVMSRLKPDAGYQDDVALLLYRQPVPLELTLPADAHQLAATRAAMRSWLEQAGMSPDQIINVLIAAGEALANAIEHGHRDSPEGAVNLRVIALTDRVHVTVTDSGSWKKSMPDPNTTRGRGISLIQSLMHDVTIESDGTGTTVQMHARIA